MDSKTLKKLIRITVLILIISYALDKVIFFGLNKLSDNVMTGQAVGKLNHFMSVKDSSDILVFGNSRANRHIDVDAFDENGFNIGVDGTGIAYISTLINTLDKTNEQFVLVHIDTKDFFKEGYDGSDIKALKIKYNRNKTITKALRKSGHISMLQDFYYAINYNGNAIGIIKNYFKPSYNHENYNGYDALTVSSSQEDARDAVLNFNEDVDCPDDVEANQLAVDYLRDIKSYLESSNKKFLFVTSPIYDDKCQTDNYKLAALMKALKLPYIDFSNYYEVKNNTFWKDRKHMTKQGAEDFSSILKTYITR